VTAGQPQDRTVSVRLCSMLSRGRSSTVRRLLVVGGIAVAGWLLGSAGQAHADTALPAPVAAVAPHTALSPLVDGTHVDGTHVDGTHVDHMGLADKVPHEVRGSVPHHEQSVRGSTKTACGAAHRSPGHPRGRKTGGTTDGALPAPRVSVASSPQSAVSDLAHTLADPVLNLFGQGGILDTANAVDSALPVRPSLILEALPSEIKQVVADLVSAGSTMGRTPSGVSWVLGHRNGAVAGSGRQKMANAVTAGTASGAPKNARSGWTVTHAVFSHPAPGSEFPRPVNPQPVSPQPGGVPMLSGSALTCGGLGHVTRPGANARPTLALPPMLGAVPPAVHTATDEPSFSPD
jgi:hypothetical protein